MQHAVAENRVHLARCCAWPHTGELPVLKVHEQFACAGESSGDRPNYNRAHDTTTIAAVARSQLDMQNVAVLQRLVRDGSVQEVPATACGDAADVMGIAALSDKLPNGLRGRVARSHPRFERLGNRL